MKLLIKPFLLTVCLSLAVLCSAQTFDLIPLGVHGGGEESNLSSYLLGETGKHEYTALDAGTLRSGIDKAIENGIFSESNVTVLRDYIKGYFISHGHLDHLAGLVINSPDDSKKNIYGLPVTINILETKYFTNESWANFANEGDSPQIGTYTYKRIANGGTFNIEGTHLKGRIFELSHGNPYKSSAILVTDPKGNSVLYLGDTGADRIEKSHDLENLWTAVAPQIQDGTLKAIMIEVSFDNSQPENKLFGHLTPKLLNEELSRLAKTAGKKDLSDLKIIVTHMKPGNNRIEKIKHELAIDNPIKVHFIFPMQGEIIPL